MYISVLFILIIPICASYNILAVFPYNGRSHHIYFSALVEELATRKHNVTVVNYFPVKKLPNLYQISLQTNDVTSDAVDMEDHLRELPNHLFVDFFKAYDSAKAFKYIANSNCEKLVTNKEVQRIVKEIKFDLVIAEQFVTDCGLALAHILKAPAVGMTAHILMPWTYSRLGAPNNPSFVPNHIFGTGTKPDLLNRIKSSIFNTFLNVYHRFVMQSNDHEIIKRVFPDIPDLEILGRNMSLILLNQYFPLTGSRLHGANVIEVGGMHIKDAIELKDEELTNFMESAENGVIYISFGSVAKNFPRRVLHEITKLMRKSSMKFIWKVDEIDDLDVRNNTLLRKWIPQAAVLSHPKVVAFVTHSGMLSSSEAMHYGVPVVCVPLFGDQFANAQSVLENGLGVTVDIVTLDENVLHQAIKTVLQEGYQTRAKQLSKLWKDRPMSPMDTAIYWIEYTARHKGDVNMKPPTVDLPLYQYLMVDIICVLGLIIITIVLIITRLLAFTVKLFSKKQKALDVKKKKY